MSEEATNGNAADLAQAQQAQVNQQISAQLAGWCSAVVASGARGIMHSLPHIPPKLVLLYFCRTLGTFVGTAFHGTLGEILTARRECREAFLDGLKAAGAPPLPAAPPQSMTRQN